MSIINANVPATAPTVQSELDRGNLNDLADMARRIALGSVLAALAKSAVEETVTVTANVGVLSRRALSVLAISAVAGGATGLVTPQSATALIVSKGCAISLDQKTLTFAAADAVTQAKVTYVPAPAGLEAALAIPV
jgi:hypothetical protein